MWTYLAPSLVHQLRAAGCTTDGLCPACWRDRAAGAGMRQPPVAAVARALQELPDYHADPFVDLVELGDLVELAGVGGGTGAANSTGPG